MYTLTLSYECATLFTTLLFIATLGLGFSLGDFFAREDEHRQRKEGRHAA